MKVTHLQRHKIVELMAELESLLGYVDDLAKVRAGKLGVTIQGRYIEGEMASDEKARIQDVLVDYCLERIMHVELDLHNLGCFIKYVEPDHPDAVMAT